MTDKAASGTMLLEPETTQTEINPPPAGRGSTRYLWLLLAIVAMAGLVIWALVQTSSNETTEETLRVPSDHDAAIMQLLGSRDISSDGQLQHDAGIAHLLRERQTPQTAHDSGIAAALRERANAAPDCVPLTEGAGGWEARTALGC